jgi:hypothetical protein
MENSNEINEIAGALSKFQGIVPSISKSKTAKIRGTSQKSGKDYDMSYNYADIADVLKSIRKPLSECGLAIVQSSSLSIEGVNNNPHEYVSVHTKIIHKSGQWFSDTLKASLMANKGQMSNIQAIGSINTYLRRYLAAAMLGIATDDDIDGHITGEGQTNEQAEVENLKQHSENFLVNIVNPEVVKWIKGYIKNNSGLNQMRKIYDIVCWECNIEKKISEVRRVADLMIEQDAIIAHEHINKIDSKRVDNIEDGKFSIGKLDAIYSNMEKKLEESNG